VKRDLSGLMIDLDVARDVFVTFGACTVIAEMELRESVVRSIETRVTRRGRGYDHIQQEESDAGDSGKNT